MQQNTSVWFITLDNKQFSLSAFILFQGILSPYYYLLVTMISCQDEIFSTIQCCSISCLAVIFDVFFKTHTHTHPISCGLFFCFQRKAHLFTLGGTIWFSFSWRGGSRSFQSGNTKEAHSNRAEKSGFAHTGPSILFQHNPKHLPQGLHLGRGHFSRSTSRYCFCFDRKCLPSSGNRE